MAHSFALLDTGAYDSLPDAAGLNAILQKLKGLIVTRLEEIACRQSRISVEASTSRST